MKILVIIFLTSMILWYLEACTKTITQQKNIYSVAGKWQVLNDSVYTGVGLSNHEEIYTGIPGDYFQFSTSDTVYTKEGSVLDTLFYLQTSDSTLNISSFGITLNGVPPVSYLAYYGADRLRISTAFVATPGGTFGRTVNLYR